MGNRYNFSYFEAEYRVYLVALNTNPVTIKNYLSDLRYFFSWLQSIFKVDAASYSELPSLLSKATIAQYYSFLHEQNGSGLTLKRRLSTIRSFISFCVKQRWLTEHTTKQVENDREVAEKAKVINEYCSYVMLHDKKCDLARIKALITSFVMSY